MWKVGNGTRIGQREKLSCDSLGQLHGELWSQNGLSESYHKLGHDDQAFFIYLSCQSVCLSIQAALGVLVQLQHVGSFGVAHGLSYPKAHGIFVSQPGIEPAFPALEGRFLTTGPPGKSLHAFILHHSILDVEKTVTSVRIALCSLEQSLLEAVFCRYNCQQVFLEMGFEWFLSVYHTSFPLLHPQLNHQPQLN